jgi:hypothetical protein
MNRRHFLQLAGAGAAVFTLDPERLLWRPGTKTYVTAPPGGWWKDGGLWHIPEGYTLEVVPDPAYETQRALLMGMLADTDRRVVEVLHDLPHYTWAVDILARQRREIRNHLLWLHDTRRQSFLLVPPRTP